MVRLYAAAYSSTRFAGCRISTALRNRDVWPLYLAGALALGAGFLYWAVVLIRNNNEKAPMETFRYSILYLGHSFGHADRSLSVSGVSSTAPIEMTHYRPNL